MKRHRLLLTCLAAAVAVTLSGCDKIPLFKKDQEPETPVETAQEAPEAQAAAAVATAEAAPPAPTPEPTPEKEEINRNAGVIVLCYHRFTEKNPDNLSMTPEMFESQMQALKDAGISVIGMQDFIAWRRGEKNIPEKSCIITIDDGYVSAYTLAWPILKKFEYPFTMFVYMDYIGIGGQSITWDQLADMRDQGVDIQSHTWSHQNLKGKGGQINKKNRADLAKMGYEAWLQREIGDTKKTLEERLGIRVNAIAYPYGLHSEESRAMTLKTGHEVGFTVYGQRNGFDFPAAEQIGRYAIGSKQPEIFEAALRAINSESAGGSAGPSISHVASGSVTTTPADGATVSEAKPTLTADLSSFGEIEAGSVDMRISGFGLVPANYDAATKTVSYTFTQPLRDKSYTVIVGARVDGRKKEARWGFNYAPAQ